MQGTVFSDGFAGFPSQSYESVLVSSSLKLHLFILQGKGTPMCHGVHFEIRGQLEGAGSLLA